MTIVNTQLPGRRLTYNTDDCDFAPLTRPPKSVLLLLGHLSVVAPDLAAGGTNGLLRKLLLLALVPRAHCCPFVLDPRMLLDSQLAPRSPTAAPFNSCAPGATVLEPGATVLEPGAALGIT